MILGTQKDLTSIPWWRKAGLGGFLTYSLYLVLSKFGIPVKNRLFPIKVKGSRHIFFGRFGSSDPAVFKQIFVEREYSCLRNVHSPKLIIDCGANVGYSSIWFLNRYPNAHLIAIEPDAGNFALCQKNLWPYRDRVKFVKGAVWPYETRLSLVNGKDKREWAFQVREFARNEKNNEKNSVQGYEIGALLKESGFDEIDILKIDIEKAEKMLFTGRYESWLNKVKNIVIELHDEECEEIFFKALSPYRYRFSKSGELTVCKNISSGNLLTAPAAAVA